MITTNIGEEVSVVAKDVGLVGVGLNGAFVAVLGGIVVAANIGEKESVVVEVTGLLGV